jgi:4-carboxymuconolactone decarboxylase
MPARIPLVDPAALDDAQRATFDRIAGSRGRVAGPFLALLHSPELAERTQQLGAFIRSGTTLDAASRELAILVTARAWSSQFEWSAHAPIAAEAGVAEDVIAAVAAGTNPDLLEPTQAAVHDYALELSRTGVVSDSTYAVALERLDVVGLVELTALVGYYTLLAMTLNAHEIEPPDGSRPLPGLPDARR